MKLFLMQNKYLFLIIVLLSLSSCYKVVDFKPSEIEQQIVVNGVMLPDHYLTVSVRKTARFLDAAPEDVENARVELWAGTEMVEIMTHDSSAYYSTKMHKTQIGIIYTLKVYVAGYDIVTGQDCIPEPQGFEIITFEESSYSTEISEDYYLLSFKVNHSENHNKYYRFYAPNSSSYYGTTNVTHENTRFTSDDAFVLNSHYLSDFFIFPDSSIQDSFQTIHLYIESNWFINQIPENTDIKCLAVFESISENYYDYLESLILYSTNYSSNDPSSTFEGLNTNIENGLGIFAGCNPSTDTLIWSGQIVAP